MPRELCYLSMLCEPGSAERAVCGAHADGADDGAWLAARLAERGLGGAFRHTTIDIARGEALPPVERYDCVVLGGTFHGVHDGRPWQQPLREWLAAHRRTGRPLLGICGGHQAMAVVAGGEVARRVGGTALGSVPLSLTPAGAAHPLLAALPPAPRFHFGNSDHVCAVPPGAAVLATTPDSPAVALDYPGCGWCSVQFHPEASHAIFQYWVDEGVLGAPPDEHAFRPLSNGARLLANFLDGGQPRL